MGYVFGNVLQSYIKCTLIAHHHIISHTVTTCTCTWYAYLDNNFALLDYKGLVVDNFPINIVQSHGFSFFGQFKAR